MTPSEARAVAALPSHWRRFVRAHYNLPKHVVLSHALCARGISLLDLTLMLARRAGTNCALAALVGKPVTVYPAVRLRYGVNGRTPTPIVPRCRRDLVISHVNRGAVDLRYGRMLAVGRSLRAAHAFGVPWRSLDRYVDLGYVRLSPSTGRARIRKYRECR